MTPPGGAAGTADHPWADWWAATADGMSAAQRGAVWDLFDQLRLHEVRELPLED